MSQKNIIAVVAVVVIIGGLAAYAMTSRPVPGPGMMQENRREDSGNIGPKSLQDLVAAGQPVSCSFSDSADQSNTSGTIYVSGGRVRGDFSALVSGRTMMNHMIVKDKTSYIWGDDSRQGMKMMMSDEQSQQQPQQPAQGIDPAKKMNYTCSPWAGGDDQFNIPADVTFTEFNPSAMMKTQGTTGVVVPGSTGTPDTFNGTSGSQCAVCDSLPAGAAQDQCRKSLNCM